jgi:hypothetical protein
MSKHNQSLPESRRESNGDIPWNREVFYDWDNVYIDDEAGQEYPTSIVEDTWHGGAHSIENMAHRMEYKLELGRTFVHVEAETCEVDRLHFVRIMSVPGYGAFATEPIETRQYVWDVNH